MRADLAARHSAGCPAGLKLDEAHGRETTGREPGRQAGAARAPQFVPRSIPSQVHITL